MALKEVHLVVLIHGLWGSPAHLAIAKEELEAAYHASHRKTISKGTQISGPTDDPIVEGRVEGRGKGGDDELVIMIAGGMTSQLTYDGVDVCASRVAYEVDEEVKKLEKEGKKVSRFSVTGYSLGGLVARYLVGLLQSRTPSFFDVHRPESFSTIATPHLGIPRYNTFLSISLVWLGSKLLSRSGEQLYVTDKYSDQDPRPLLEIMADPDQIFVQGLEKFHRLRIYGNAIKDDTVPYPSAAIDTVDHFTNWADRGIIVESDEDGIMQSWRRESNSKEQKVARANKQKKGWMGKLGTLPPVLKYRYPYNYIILLFLPVMVPLIMILIISRSLLDTRRSQRRLQRLAQTKLPITAPDLDSSDQTSAHSSTGSPSTLIPSAHGLSIDALRQVIRRVERSIESDLLDSGQQDVSVHGRPSGPKAKGDKTPDPKENGCGDGDGDEDDDESDLKVYMKESQLRMAVWLNSLPWKKLLTWYPEISNSHAVIIVRDPATFPTHDRGRGLLRRWAKGVLDNEED